MIFPLAAAAFLSLAHASSGTFAGYDTPAFWTMRYSIPRSYCYHQIVAEVPKVSTDVVSAISCPPENREAQNGDLYVICRAPKDIVQRSASRVKELTNPIFEKNSCAETPEFPELAYKIQRLEEEFPLSHVSSLTAPGLMGLYAAQIQTLNRIQKRHQRAQIPTLEVFLSTGGRCSGPACEGFLETRWKSSRDWQEEAGIAHHGFNPWSRDDFPSCWQVPAIHIFLDMDSKSAEASDTKAALMKLGDPYYEEYNCSRTGSPSFMVFSKKPLRKVVEATLRLPAIKSWSRGKKREANTKTDDERVEVLDRELKFVDLRRAPHLRSLANGERERVRESSDRIRKLKSGVLVIVSFDKK